MKETGIDLSGPTTTHLTPDVAKQANTLVTMGCSDDCPYVQGAKRDDWPLDDPKGRSVEDVRRIRDDRAITGGFSRHPGCSCRARVQWGAMRHGIAGIDGILGVLESVSYRFH
jgi:hypothetical protein